MNITSWEDCCRKGNKHKERSSREYGREDRLGISGFVLIRKKNRLKRERGGIVQAARNKKNPNKTFSEV